MQTQAHAAILNNLQHFPSTPRQHCCHSRLHRCSAITNKSELHSTPRHRTTCTLL